MNGLDENGKQVSTSTRVSGGSLGRIALGMLLMLTTPAGWSDAAGDAAGAKLPNVVFILADDIGYADLAASHEATVGTPAVVPTPNLDRLAEEGMMFLDAHTPASLCAPNRFSIMTGSNPYRSRAWGTWSRTASSAFHFGPGDGDRAGNPHRTVGEVMQAGGYRTAYFGKMHFGGDFYDSLGTVVRDGGQAGLATIDYSRRFDNGLRDHGFDYTFVTPDGIQGILYAYFENDLWAPISDFAGAGQIPGVDVSGPSFMRPWDAGDTLGNGEFLADGYGDSEFDTSEHGPILSGKAVDFIDDHLARFPDQPFLLYYAAPAIHVPLTPSAAGLVADGVTGVSPRADFVYDLDLQVGQLLAALDRAGIAENTLVFFTSDNGGTFKATEPQLVAGQRPNGLLRAAKGSIYEGGHRVPFLAKWGDGTPAGSVIRPGTVCSQLISVIDWVMSMKDLLGQPVAGDQHYDAVSLLPLLFAEDPDQVPPVRTMHYQKTNNDPVHYAVRMNDGEGKWFYLRYRAGSWDQELYDLAADIGQATNLLSGFAAPADLPANHPHRTRVDTMNAWFVAHDGYADARSTEATDFRPAVVTSNLVVDAGFEDRAPSSYPNASGEPWFILNEDGNIWAAQVRTNNGATAHSGSNLFSFQYYYATDILTQNIGSAFPIDGLKPYELSCWARLGESGSSTNPPSLAMEVLAAPSVGGNYVRIKASTGHLPSEDAYTRFSLALHPEDMGPYHGQYLQIRIQKDFAGTTHRIAVDDVSLSTEVSVATTAKTPIPVPVPPATLRLSGGVPAPLLSMANLHPAATYTVQRVTALSDAWTDKAVVAPDQTTTNWMDPDGVLPHAYYRTAHPDRVDTLVLPGMSPP